MSEMISFGAGVNSVAMTIMLVNDGWRGPIVFADPGAEHPDTYCYLEYFEREWLKSRGLAVTTISPRTHPELYGPSYRMRLIDKCIDKSIVPIIASRWCTDKYKRRPLAKWAQTNNIELQYIGIAYEERHRARFTESNGIAIEYPLVDRRIGRAGCRSIIAREKMPIPPKSGCWFCPFQRVAEWKALYDLRPDLFDDAIQMDLEAIKKSGRPGQLHLGVSLGMHLQAARMMWDAQLELPLMPEPEYEYQMCECRL